ncbi:LysR substrate-binding domain-containing protein [Ralstonia pseudosolanacearum]
MGSKSAAAQRDLVGETLVIYPKQPRPSVADQVLALFHDRAQEPGRLYEARELQIALKRVAAGAGVSVVPRSVEEVYYVKLDDPQLVSPIHLSTRLLDASEDIRTIRARIYRLYDEQNIPDYPPSQGPGPPALGACGRCIPVNGAPGAARRHAPD